MSHKYYVPNPGSQIGQDVFVLETLNNKVSGTFVDVGSAHPSQINNTYILEKQYGWTGISVDLGESTLASWNTWANPQEYKSFWEAERNTPIITGNALEMDFSKLFNEHSLPKVIDYLTIDLEPPDSLECLINLPFDEYCFRTITFEHATAMGFRIADTAREFLGKRKYVLVKTVKGQDDFFVHSSLGLSGLSPPPPGSFF